MMNFLKKLLPDYFSDFGKVGSQPKDARLVFEVRHGSIVIGTLSIEGDNCTFQYSKEYSSDNDLATIVGFPDKKKVYKAKSDELWPFFVARIPKVNQPFMEKRIAKYKANKDNPFDILWLFGRNSINNPYIVERILPVA